MRRGSTGLRAVPGLVVAVAVLGTASAGSAQVRLDELVFTGGLSGESYRGNLATVAVPVVDSTERVAAAVGEFGARGRVFLVESLTGAPWDHRLSLRFDAGLRQFAAAGFELRDYAPREWVGSAGVAWAQKLAGAGQITLSGSARGRAVQDRPPMPLFLQPGYTTVRGAVTFQTYDIQGVSLEVELDAEDTDYEALDFVRQLDLLDRHGRGFEVAALAARESWTIRFYGGLRGTDYPRQDSFDPDDPFRRDRTFHMGADWTLDGPFRAEVGVRGTVNRSNSRRPEYDAVSGRASLTTPLPFWDLGLNLFGVLTGKTYVFESPFARLVPGEEADNASLAYVELNRPLAPNLSTSLRFGWTRAETDIGESYYSRFGTSLLLHFRP